MAEGTHADLQEKPKKAAAKEVNGQPDDLQENGLDAKSNSIDALTHATSAATLSDAQTMSAKQPINRATLQEQ